MIELLMVIATVMYAVISSFIVMDVWFDFKMSNYIKRKIGWFK
jgi:hypothetical protein